jgi:hypothetical protein
MLLVPFWVFPLIIVFRALCTSKCGEVGSCEKRKEKEEYLATI